MLNYKLFSRYGLFVKATQQYINFTVFYMLTSSPTTGMDTGVKHHPTGIDQGVPVMGVKPTIPGAYGPSMNVVC